MVPESQGAQVTVYVCDGELVCEGCAVDCDESDAAIGGESDSPSHCGYCHRPLFDTFGLTGRGMQYVLESVRDSLKHGLNGPRKDWRWPSGYYEGMGYHAVTRDWAEWALDNYGMSDCEPVRPERRPEQRMKRTLELYLYFTRNAP
jgi:hypothetical protein